MASDRDTLAEQLDAVAQRGHGQQFLAPFFRGVVDLALAAGWRPPAQVLESAPELDAMPVGTIVLGYGVAHQAVPPSEFGMYPLWIKPTGRLQTSSELLADCRGEGVTVLYQPEEEADDDDQ